MTLRCIAGIERPDEGRIVLGDRVLFDSAQKINLPPQKRRVGLLFQNYALFPTMTVEQNIVASLSKKDRGQVAEYIRRFRLEGLERRLPDQLSGGSSSGRRWPGCSLLSLTCSCWTSHSPPWTPTCAGNWSRR